MTISAFQHISIHLALPILSLSAQKGMAFTVLCTNVILKEHKRKYMLKIKHFSCHSLIKTFGGQIYNTNSDNAELELV